MIESKLSPGAFKAANWCGRAANAVTMFGLGVGYSTGRWDIVGAGVVVFVVGVIVALIIDHRAQVAELRRVRDERNRQMMQQMAEWRAAR